MFEINISPDGGNTFIPALMFADDSAPSGSLYTVSFSSAATLPKGGFRLQCLAFMIARLAASRHQKYCSRFTFLYCICCFPFAGNLILQFVYKTNNPKAPAAFYQCADIQSF